MQIFVRNRAVATAALVIEALALLALSALLAAVVFDLLDQRTADEALLRSPPDWGEAAKSEALRMLLRWGPLLTIAVILAHRRGFWLLRPTRSRSPAADWKTLVATGLGVGLILAPLSTLPRYFHYSGTGLGDVPAIWDILYFAEWNTEFWLFMAVGSFLIVPIVEELFFRGYFLGSLLRELQPAWAIGVSSLVFAAVHVQYLRLDTFSIYNSMTVIISAVAAAWLVVKTRSLLPAIVAHAYSNVPRPLDWAPFEPILGIAGAALLFWCVRRMAEGARPS